MADKREREPDSAASDSSADGSSEKSGNTEASESQQHPAANLSLREQLEAARAERDANYDLYLRAQAELANYRKRVQKEADELRLYQALPLGRDLLPALDNLHRALAAAETSKNIDQLLEGLRLVIKQIEGALNRHQIVAIEAAGKPFDPNLHQAVQQMPSAKHPPMTVLHEVERGFTLQDRVVRPATVIVAQAPSDSESPSTTNKSASDKSKTSSTEEE